MTEIDVKLLDKYNVPGPRYTSYPTAVQFKEANEQDLVGLRKYLNRRSRSPQPLSIYIHIPFCFSLCWYCGCTKVITRDQSRSEAYLSYLEKEMEMIAPLIHADSRVRQLHLGGGTPTFLSPEELRRLSKMVKNYFRVDPDMEASIEIDPRRLSRDHISALAESGFNRASIGVQDTNPRVQEAVHRIQPFDQVKKVTGWLREDGIRSVNFDLIYGLPQQTKESFAATLNEVTELKPDRLAVYSYAHVPWIMPAQKLLDEENLPAGNEKLAMLIQTIDFLTDNGYRYIGMDHFARENDELSTAMENGTLHRNFQGYSTLAGMDLYAFGMSGISNVGDRYWQNSKDMNHYYKMLEEGNLPVSKTYQLDRDDRIRKYVIMRLMCRPEIEFKEIENRWNIVFFDYFERELQRLSKLESDGLVKCHREGINITTKGRLFLRNIAMCFDRYLNRERATQKYSKTV